MNCNYILKGSFFALIVAAFTLTSCEADDVCLPEEAPFVTLNFHYPNSETDLEDTIFYKAYVNDTLLIGEGNNTKDLSVLNLPILTTTDLSVKYILEQGTTYNTIQIDGTDTIRTTHTAPKDSLYINYTLDNQYNSKGCGFGIYFKDATFTNSSTWIQSTQIVNTTINDATSTNLIIFAEPRSY